MLSRKQTVTSIASWAAIAIVMAVASPRPGYCRPGPPPDAPGAMKRTELSEQWLFSVTHNDPHAAMALAVELVAGKAPGSIPKHHLELGGREGIRESFFKAPFNFWDFVSWRDACFFSRLSQKITRGDSDNIKGLFQGVVTQVAPDEKGFKDVPWPYVIWHRGYGVCDRQAWVFCELAYQMGWETQIVYLWDKAAKTSPHTVAEIRRGHDVYFVDVYKKVLLKKSVAAVASDDVLLKKIWDMETLWSGIKNSIFWTPSYPQDYCPRNQQLQAVLKEDLKSRCPRFGVPPDRRLSNYRELSKKTVFDKPRFQIRLWFYPFRLLRSDIIRHCRKYGLHFLR